jgi:hypothetical protein
VEAGLAGDDLIAIQSQSHSRVKGGIIYRSMRRVGIGSNEIKIPRK